MRLLNLQLLPAAGLIVPAGFPTAILALHRMLDEAEQTEPAPWFEIHGRIDRPPSGPLPVEPDEVWATVFLETGGIEFHPMHLVEEDAEPRTWPPDDWLRAAWSTGPLWPVVGPDYHPSESTTWVPYSAGEIFRSAELVNATVVVQARVGETVDCVVWGPRAAEIYAAWFCLPLGGVPGVIPPPGGEDAWRGVWP